MAHAHDGAVAVHCSANRIAAQKDVAGHARDRFIGNKKPVAVAMDADSTGGEFAAHRGDEVVAVAKFDEVAAVRQTVEGVFQLLPVVTLHAQFFEEVFQIGASLGLLCNMFEQRWVGHMSIIEAMRPSILTASVLIASALVFAASPQKVADKKTGSRKADKKTAVPVVGYGDQKYKTTGSATAPVTVELYTDFQCPSCRVMFLESLPPLEKEYVATGKVKLVHRDYPLPMHPYARQAAKFANCAGVMGRYDIVASQIFKTQQDWSQNGNLDGAIAKVLPPGEMQKLRAMVADPNLDEGTAIDVAQGMRDQLSQTPTMVIVAKGKREVIGGNTPFPILKSFIDGKLGK